MADLQSYNPSAASRAAVRLEELSALYPRSPEVEESLAALALRSGDEAGMVAHMNKAYQRGSKDVELLIVDAQLEMKTGTPEAQIIPLLERAVAEKPDSYRARILHRRPSGRRRYAIKTGHFGPSGALSRQIFRETPKKRLLLQVRQRLLYELADMDEPIGVGWVLK